MKKISSVFLIGILGFSVCYAMIVNEYKNEREQLPYDIRIFTSYDDVYPLAVERCILKCHNNVSHTIEEGHTITFNSNKDSYIIIIADDGGNIKAHLHYKDKDMASLRRKIVLQDLYRETALNRGELEKDPPPTFDLFGNGHKDLALYAGTHKTVDRFLLIRCKIPTKN